MDSEFMVSWRTYREPGQGRPGDQDGKIVRSRGAEQRGDSSVDRRRGEEPKTKRTGDSMEDAKRNMRSRAFPRLLVSSDRCQRPSPTLFFGCVVIEV